MERSEQNADILYEDLKKNIMDVIKESQVKLGFEKKSGDHLLSDRGIEPFAGYGFRRRTNGSMLTKFCKESQRSVR